MIKNTNSKADTASHGDYASPSVKTVLLQPEGVLCSSLEGVSHDGFEEDGYYEF